MEDGRIRLDIRSGIAFSAWASFHATRSARFLRFGSLSKLALIKSSSTLANSWSIDEVL